MKNLIIKLLKKALKEEKVNLKEEEIGNLLEIPPSSEIGDFAFPCFFLAGKLKQEPNQIALQIRGKIGDPPKELEGIQTSGPYINFFVKRESFANKIIKEILAKKENFGRENFGNRKKVLVEHTSINPNSSPHVGRVRNAIIGDYIVRILRFMNYCPEVHYYVNNVSKQISMLVLANAENLKFEDMLKNYISISKKVRKSKKLEKKVFEFLSDFEKGNKKIAKKFNKITKTCVNGQKKILSDLGIHYDFFDYESDYLKYSKKILSDLEKTKKIFKDENGRFILDQKETSVKNKMKSPVLVLTRGDGTGLYPLRDIAYTIAKIKITKKNIIVLGEDQKLYFQQIKEALKLLKFNAPEVVHYSFVLLRGKSKKMSTRKGDVILMEDFIKDAIKKAKAETLKRKIKGNPRKVGICAVKYTILKVNPNKSVLFSLDDSLNFEGDTGPYLLYSYARASSILRKSKIKPRPASKMELEPKEIELIKKFSQFPAIVLNSYRNLNPSIIANYSYQLAQLFNEFYHSCKVLNSDNESFRISLVESFRIILKNSLKLLGIETIEKM